MTASWLIRTIFVAAICAIGLVFYFTLEGLFLGPIRAEDARVADLIGQLDELTQRESAARKELVELDDQQGSDSGTEVLLVSPSAEVSSSALQERVRNAIASTGGSLIMSQANVQEPINGSSKISVLVRARFDEIGLLNFTRVLETSQQAVIFESFEVHPSPLQGSAAGLEFTGVVVGFHSDAH